jgi:predicted component of type VI protein secretion system
MEETITNLATRLTDVSVKILNFKQSTKHLTIEINGMIFINQVKGLFLFPLVIEGAPLDRINL